MNLIQHTGGVYLLREKNAFDFELWAGKASYEGYK